MVKMSNSFQLPAILTFESCQSNWQQYEDTLYQIYLADLYNNPPTYQGLAVKTKYHPPYKNKAYSFWHITHEGPNEETRTPDFRRCERLCWIKPMINNANLFACWSKTTLVKGRQRERHYIWNSQEKYLIVLEKHKTNFFLVTAYYIEHQSRVVKYNKEYEKYAQK